MRKNLSAKLSAKSNNSPKKKFSIVSKHKSGFNFSNKVNGATKIG